MIRKLIIMSLLLCSYGYIYGQALEPLKMLKLTDVSTFEEVDNIIQNQQSPIIIVSFSIFCSPCLRELKALSKVSKKWQDKYGVKLLIVSNDTDEKYQKRLMKFEKKHDFFFPLYLDTEGELAKMLYQLPKIDKEQFILNGSKIKIKNPQTFILSSKGVLMKQKRGYMPGDELILEKYIDL